MPIFRRNSQRSTNSRSVVSKADPDRPSSASPHPDRTEQLREAQRESSSSITTEGAGRTKAATPHIDIPRDDTDYSAYDAAVHTPTQDLPHGSALKNRYRSKSVSRKLMNLFSPHAASGDSFSTLNTQVDQISLQESHQVCPSTSASSSSSTLAPMQPPRSSESSDSHRSNRPVISVQTKSQAMQQPLPAQRPQQTQQPLPVQPPQQTPTQQEADQLPSRSRSSSPPSDTPISASPMSAPANMQPQNFANTKLSIMPSVPENSLDQMLHDDQELPSSSDFETTGKSTVRKHHHHHHHHHHRHAKDKLAEKDGKLSRHTSSRSKTGLSAGSNTKSLPSSPVFPSAECPVLPVMDSAGEDFLLRSPLEPDIVPYQPASASDSSSGHNSRSNSSDGSQQRSSSVGVALSEASHIEQLKHTQSINYSSAHLLNQKMFKGKGSRVKVFNDGRHEHDYTRYRTAPVRANRGIFGWMKRKDMDEEESFATVEKSVSLLPDSYSTQLMELKNNPENYRWNYDDDDEDGDGDEDDDDEEEIAFDDEGDDELIEPIIGKEQLRLINVMMDKIEHKDKFQERLCTKGSSKMHLAEKYGCVEGVIGKGSYGTVSISSKASPDDKKHKVYFAIKQLKQRPNESLHHFGNRVTSEFMISSSLTHQAIINVYDLMVDPVTMTYCQVMEYIPCGDLFGLISQTGGLEVIECDCFFKQILNALTYLHSVGISHNDLKVENLLLMRNGQLKIIDFGTSAVFKTAWEDKVQYSRGPCGSERYVSPEQYNLEKDYDPRLADVWSLGVIYLVMFFGNYSWDVAKESDERYDTYLEQRAVYNYSKRSTSQPKQFRTVSKGTFNPIESISGGKYANSRRYVLYNILNPDTTYRMRTYQIWQSDWIKNFQVCEAGRGYVSYDDYLDFALKSHPGIPSPGTAVSATVPSPVVPSPKAAFS